MVQDLHFMTMTQQNEVMNFIRFSLQRILENKLPSAFFQPRQYGISSSTAAPAEKDARETTLKYY